MGDGPRILIIGGGYGGMHTALRLERLLRPGEATVIVLLSPREVVSLDVLEHPQQDFREALHVIAAEPAETPPGLSLPA